MSTIKIKIPDGFRIGSFDQSTGEMKFEPIPKKVTERIKTFDDVLAELGIDARVYEANNAGLSDDEIAYRQVKYIARALNEGWEPDWTNSNQYKYRPLFKFNDASAVGGFSYLDFAYGRSASAVGSRLCFKSSELAEYAGKQFLDIYRRFMTL